MNPVIHVAHASIWIPDEVRCQFEISSADLRDEAMQSADLHTDALAHAAWPSAEIVKASVSRIVIDVERYADDAHEEMASFGRGMIYTRAHDGRDLMRDLTAEARKELKARFYDPHWLELRSKASGRTLIDLHTYPRQPWSTEPNPTADRPEIDLVATEGITPDGWVDELGRYFGNAGYHVGCNTPYVGVIDTGASAAIMLEIRCDVLGSPEDAVRWDRMVRALTDIPFHC